MKIVQGINTKLSDFQEHIAACEECLAHPDELCRTGIILLKAEADNEGVIAESERKG